MLMLHTCIVGSVVVTGDKESDVKPGASVLNGIRVGRLNVEIATDFFREQNQGGTLIVGLVKPVLLEPWNNHVTRICEFCSQV